MPQPYTLNLTINAADLTTISAAGENIIIAKPVDNPLGAPSVAWLSFSPMENNTVQWTEQYAIYASETQVQSGVTIFVASATAYPASDGVCYEFATSNVFKGAIAAPQPVSSGSYSALNEQTNPPTMTFGLSQSALLNGSNISLSPINA